MLRLALLLALLATAASAPVLPGPLRDVDGAVVDLPGLAADGRVFLVTLRSPFCPVCARQLLRLERQRPGLELCGVRFVVLAPGSDEQLRHVRDTTGLHARWIADADGALAGPLGLVLRPGQLVPAILELDGAGRVVWQQRGRGGTYYGDGALQEHLRCEQRET